MPFKRVCSNLSTYNRMTLFVYIVIILFVYVTYKSTINGLCMFIAIRALVPEIVRSPIDFLSLNSFIILIFFPLKPLYHRMNNPLNSPFLKYTL